MKIKNIKQKLFLSVQAINLTSGGLNITAFFWKNIF